MASSYAKPVVCPVLIGRESQLEALEPLLALAQAGEGQSVLVSGEAGVGKSRLLAEVRNRTGGHFLILQGHAFEHDASFPYAPLIDMLRTLFAHDPAATVLQPDVLAGELVKLLPELSLSVPDLKPSPALEPEAEKRRLFEVLAQFLTRLSESQSLLVVLEDLHWSDETSLDFQPGACQRHRIAQYRWSRHKISRRSS